MFRGGEDGPAKALEVLLEFEVPFGWGGFGEEPARVDKGSDISL